MTDARLMVGVVGPPERTELAEKIRAFVGHLGRAQPINGIAARLLAKLHELVADLVDRGMPGEPRPLTVYKLHRIAQPAVAVHELAHRGALRAMRAAVNRRMPARLLADPDAIQDLGGDGATDRT